MSAAVLRIVVVAVLIASGLGCRASKATSDDGRSDAAASVAPASSTRTGCGPILVEPKPPVAHPPMAMGLGACTREAVGRLFGACFQPGGDCTAWKAANQACARCVFTPEGAEGPFLTRDGHRPRMNQRGCLDSLAPGCGAAYEATTSCTHAACEENPDCADAGASTLAACHQAAMRDSCRALMQSFSNRCGPGGLSDKRACFPPENSDDALRSFVTGLAMRACGPLPAP